MTTTDIRTDTGLSVDPETLRASRGTLLRQQEALDPIRLRPPDTGETSHLTAEVFAQVETAVAVAAADLQALAAALERLLADLDVRDDEVSSLLDELRARGLS